jgi:hypothetical protein
VSALAAVLGFARAISWQVWAVAGLLLAVGLYGCLQREAGGEAVKHEIRKSNDAAREKADEATRSVENCVGVWDRSRGVCLRDGAGR